MYNFATAYYVPIHDLHSDNFGCVFQSSMLPLLAGDHPASSVYASVLSVLGGSRPRCLVPASPGLQHGRRPTWLALILLFFSARMREVWARLAAGFVIGIACDTATSTRNIAARF